MAWRLAKSLEVLRDEANRAAPGRSKASDGTIGDAAHSNRTSDHNPDAFGVVAALDLTHDSSAGADMHVWSEVVRLSGHPALSYQIWDRHISNPDIEGGRWRPYGGSNPHTLHMHVSVKRPHYDSLVKWGLEEDMPSIEDIERASYRATVKALRQATGPDDASVPAGRWFNEAMGIMRDVHDGLDVQVDYQKLATAIVEEYLRRTQNG